MNDILKEQKIVAIQQIVDSSIKNFAEGFELRYTSEVDDPEGVINSKKNNVFIAELGKEFMFYSAFVRSFDSSFGKVLENIGNSIAKLSYEVRGRIESYLLPQQTQHIDYLLTEYDKHAIPKIDDYNNFSWVRPKNVETNKNRTPLELIHELNFSLLRKKKKTTNKCTRNYLLYI